MVDAARLDGGQPAGHRPLDATCTGIYGRRRSGKTTRATRLIHGHKRVVVFDVMGEFAKRRDFARCDTLGEVRSRLKAGRGRGFRIAYVPAGDHARMLHGLALLVWAFQLPYFDGRDRRHVLLVVEEMNLGYPASKLPTRYGGMTRAILQGAHRGIDIIGITQRPAEVSATFRGNCSETYILALAEEIDYAKVLRVIGRRHEPALRALRQLHWLCFKDGQVTTGRDRFK